MSASQFNDAPNRYAGMGVEQIILALTMELTMIQRLLFDLGIKFDKISDNKDRLIDDKDKEKRIRELEDWRTGMTAQIRFAYGMIPVFSAAAAVVGHYWK